MAVGREQNKRKGSVMPKVVIDIPKGCYEEICTASFPVQDAYRLVAWIKEGTVLPDNPTNGDMIKAMFPDIDFHCMEGAFGKISFDLVWWNSPYAKENNYD